MPLGQIVIGQQRGVHGAAGVRHRMVGDEADDPLGDLTAVEGVAGGLDAGHPAAALRALLGPAHDAQHGAEVGVAQRIAHIGHVAARQVDRTGGRIALGVPGLLRMQVAAQRRVDREALLGELDGGLQDLGEAHGPEPGQRRGPGVDRRRHARRQVAVAGNEIDAVIAAPVYGERLRRPPHARDGVGSALLRRIDERRHLAADAAALRFQERLADAHRRRRVDRVAAGNHDAQPRRSRQVVARGYHAAPSHDHRSCSESHCSNQAPTGAPYPSRARLGSNATSATRPGSTTPRTGLPVGAKHAGQRAQRLTAASSGSSTAVNSAMPAAISSGRFQP